MQFDKPMAWPVRSREVLGTGFVSSFVDEEVETPSGETMRRQYVTHPGAVGVVAWREDTDDIAVVRQYRHPVRMELVEIPAGLLDLDGEEYVVAAQRELAEEAELAPTAGTSSSTPARRRARVRSRCGSSSRVGFAPPGAPRDSSWRARRRT